MRSRKALRSPQPLWIAAWISLLMMGGVMAGSVMASNNISADPQPPTLLGLVLTPNMVNTGIRGHQIAVTLYVMDLDSGVSGAGEVEVKFRSPSGHTWVATSYYHGVPGQPENLVEGTLQNGVWRAALTLPAQSETGTWVLDYCFLADQAGNFTLLGTHDMVAFGYPSRFQVRNTAFSLRLPLALRSGPPPTPTPIPSPLPTIPQGLPVPPSQPTPAF